MAVGPEKGQELNAHGIGRRASHGPHPRWRVPDWRPPGLPIRHADVWRLLTSGEGLRLWLGGASHLSWAEGAGYRLPDGTVGEVRVFAPSSHLRLTWQPPSWLRASTIQLRVIPKGDRTVVAFHQEHLPGAREREERRAHFRAALDRLEHLLRAEQAGPADNP